MAVFGPSLATLTQQVLIECPVVRLPLSPHLAWCKAFLTVMALFSFTAAHSLVCSYLCSFLAGLLDPVKTSPVYCVSSEVSLKCAVK